MISSNWFHYSPHLAGLILQLATYRITRCHNPMTSSMTTTTTIPEEKICYMIGDSGYDDQNLYDILA